MLNLTYWVLRTESEHQSEGLVEVKRIFIEDFDVEVPCFKVVGRHEGDASWKAAGNLHNKGC